MALIDAERDYFGGGQVQELLLLEGLRRSGHRTVFVCQPGGLPEAEARRRGIETRAVRMRNSLDLPAALRLAATIRKTGVDLVHANSGRDTWLGGIAARLAGIPALTTRRLALRMKRGLRTRLMYGRLVRYTVAISPDVAERLRQGGVPDSRIVLIPDAIDPERIVPRRTREEVRSSLGIGGDQLLVLAVGALNRLKAFDVLLEAFGVLDPDAGGRLQLRVAGEGPERPALESQVRRLSLDARVRLLGRRDDVGDLLGACDIFAMPSRSEGLGVATLEAMGAGRPVVAARVGGLQFSVVDGETGVLVEPEDASRLAAALERLARDADLRRRLGDGGVARVRAEFLPEKLVDSYASLYRRMLAETRR